MATQKMPDMHTFRSTKRGTALMEKAAKAANKPLSVWQRDVCESSAESADVLRESLDPVIEQAQKGYVDLAQQISVNTATQIDRGLGQIVSAFTDLAAQLAVGTSQQIDDAVRNALDRLLAPKIQALKDEIAAQRLETHDYLQSLLIDPSPQSESDKIHAAALSAARPRQQQGKA